MKNLGENVIFFNKPFDGSAVDFLYEKITALEAEDKTEAVILINSPGGSLHCLKSILDIMQTTNIHLTTVGTGVVASCGFLMLMSGDHRAAYANTEMLSHQFASFSIGKYHELQADAKCQKDLHKWMLDHYVLHTGLDKDFINARLLRETDTWINTKEALELHVIDEILTPRTKALGAVEREKLKNKIKRNNIVEAEKFLKNNS